MEQPAPGNREHSFIPSLESHSIKIHGSASQVLGVTRLKSSVANSGHTAPHLLEDAFLLGIQLRNYAGDLYLQGRKLAFTRQAIGEIMFYDYREEWQAELLSPFDCVNFHIPLSLLDASLEDERRTKVPGLRYKPGIPTADPVVPGLVQALLPILGPNAKLNQLFIDHVGLALTAHLTRTYGDLVALRPQSTGALAPWQERRAKDYIEHKIGVGIALPVLAAECGLSTSHFARAFRISTGVAPYQWLLQRRIERARQLLLGTSQSIAEIAAACGFADQSHLSKVFVRENGEPPAAWRRRNTV